jgi:hypothetical protein
MKPLRQTIFNTVAFVLIASFLWLWASVRHPSIFSENGPMENFQVACLAIGIIVLAWAMSRTTDLVPRLFIAGIALLYFTFLVIEFDTREFDWPTVNRFLHGPVRNGTLVALWTLAFAGFWRKRHCVFDCFRLWLWTPGGIRLVIAGVFWMMAWLADKLHLFPMKEQNLLAEELIEINASLFMLWSACATLQYFSRSRHSCPRAVTPEALPGHLERLS